MADTPRVSWAHLKSREPSDADRAARRAELVQRGRAVREHGWEGSAEGWTARERAIVAYLLEDEAVLEGLEESEGEVLTRLAGELYGFQGARKEIGSGLVKTQEWVAGTRGQIGRG
ncbi:hypothetical protein D7D52_34220 [Nocardia yunnanensis]|uniref:Uncharacterized protein n=1 Tax=Nocardia yunnanensis TaxID=2382165 RepID=A0A386ZL83_9NOCA|nr:hypothetical protein D7D52_34220 [Nocardia yunnanensis]